MINVDVEAKVLLDKLYNLRSKDSVILSKMENERKIAEGTKNRTAEEKLDLATKVKELSDEEILLAREGELLKEALKNINKESFGVVFNKLNIDFDPQKLSEKVEAVLPSTIDGIKKEILTSNEKLESILKEMNDAITKIDELGIRKDEAIGNQTKLNEYIDLAIAGNINITRDALTTLLSKFDLSIQEQRECAKLLMFPEDGLYEYDERFSKKSGKSFGDVFAEAKKSEPVIIPIKLETEDIVEPTLKTPIFAPINLDNMKPMPEFKPIMEPIKASKPIIAPIVFEPIALEPIKLEPTIEDIIEPSIFDFKEEILKPIEINTISPIEITPVEPIKLSKSDLSENESVNVEDIIKQAGFKITDFSVNDLSYLKDNFSKDTFEKNVKIVSDLGLNNDLFTENVELFSDSELEDKLDTLIKVGKVPFDIYLNPNILVKYDVNELKNSIDSLKQSGLDPKKVPLMAF